MLPAFPAAEDVYGNVCSSLCCLLSSSTSEATNRDTFVLLYPFWSDAQPCVNSKKKTFNSVIHRPPPSCLCDRHQSAAAVNVFQPEFMSTSMPLSSCLLLNPLENSPPKVLGNALHQSHANERHYTLQSVWFKDDLQSFSFGGGEWKPSWR